MFLVYILSCAPQVGARWEEFTAEEHTQLASTSFALLAQGMAMICMLSSLSTGMATPRYLPRSYDPAYKTLQSKACLLHRRSELQKSHSAHALVLGPNMCT